MANRQSETADVVSRVQWRDGSRVDGTRTLAGECPVAIVANGSTLAVMLATPADLADFAIGFLVTEGVVDSAAAAGEVEIIAYPSGIEARLWLDDDRATLLADRRRAMIGPTGCGLCGIESLDAASRAPRQVTGSGPRPTPGEIVAAMAGLSAAQPLGQATRAVHGAALWRRGAPLIVREDVGRHNALDKLAGAVVRAGIDTSNAMLLLTSRVSLEMVQKAAMLGVTVVVAVSAPTRLAVDTATAAGLTLVAVARADGFEVFSHPDRIAWDG
nr:formate dehydrogenase accessory sulfurtransferase FdhD [Polymorphobacter sp.]